MSRAFRTSVHVAPGGRIVIPAEIRKECGLEVGTEIVMTVEDDHVTLMNADAAIKKAQAIVARHISPRVSLSKELMAERKREAARE